MSFNNVENRCNIKFIFVFYNEMKYTVAQKYLKLGEWKLTVFIKSFSPTFYEQLLRQFHFDKKITSPSCKHIKAVRNTFVCKSCSWNVGEIDTSCLNRIRTYWRWFQTSTALEGFFTWHVYRANDIICFLDNFFIWFVTSNKTLLFWDREKNENCVVVVVKVTNYDRWTKIWC